MDESLEDTSRKYPFPPGEIQRLESRRWILDHAKRGGRGAEVGVFRGHFSEIICARLQPETFYLVDPWEKSGPVFDWGIKDPYTNEDTLPTHVARLEASQRVGRFPTTNSIFVVGSFPSCIAEIAGPLDWIYLDASHEEQHTWWELEEAAKILQPDGVILGDDWRPERDNQHHGVFRAVTRFVKESEFEIVAAGPGAQWCIRRGA